MRGIKIRHKTDVDTSTIKEEIDFKQNVEKILPNIHFEGYLHLWWKLLDYLNN